MAKLALAGLISICIIIVVIFAAVTVSSDWDDYDGY